MVQRWCGRSRGCAISFASVLLVFLGLLALLSREDTSWRGLRLPKLDLTNGEPDQEDRPRPHHIIDDLIKESEEEFKKMTSGESDSLGAAAKAYRERRGRHPPPGFDIWYDFATKHKGLMIESLFDQIYHDVRPLWALKQEDMRRFANNFKQVLHIRDGKVEIKTDTYRPWMDQWADLISRFSEHLPNLDLAMNVMDESRIIASYESIRSNLDQEERERKLPNIAETISNYSNYVVPEGDFPIEWKSSNLWSIAREGCPPESPARMVPIETNFTSAIPPFLRYSTHLTAGYVSNWTKSKDPCIQPDLQTLHGSFIEPISISTTTQLVPMFGGSKLPMNNELLLPAPIYWNDFSPNKVYAAGSATGPDWAKRHDKMVWRGAASGGRNKADTWWHFQRHRFISMMNGTTLELAESGATDLHPAFHLPSQIYAYGQETGRKLGKWISSFTDIAFTELLCFPSENSLECSYTNPFFALGGWIDFNKVQPKYLPDIDGNSFSGRYLAFLRSKSLPIKATIYNEWHDSRLVAWQHFVPMDNSYIDIYGIMDYFLGHGNNTSHDDVAEKIALQGTAWAEKVLRSEDMLIYSFRLLLEYARVVDDQRGNLGFVGDLQ